jgi:replicative DNA helicase
MIVDVKDMLSEMNMGPLDPLARHLAPGDMVTIGGESGAGKSQLALYMGRKWGQGTSARIGIVSVEDRAHMWGDRALALECGASMLGGNKSEYTDDEGNMCRDDMEKITAAAASLSKENPFHLEVMDRADVSDVERAMLRCIRNHCGLVVVDYVQEIFDKNATKGANQAERVGDITARVKLVAKRAKVPLILCSQLSRPAKGKTEPTKHDLRGSGRLLEQSEAVALLWKKHEQDQDSMAKIVKLKMGGERPRVVLSRNKGGMISGIEEAKDDNGGSNGWGQ